MSKFFEKTRMMRSLASAAVCLALAVLVGCGGGGSTKATIRGKVAYKGAPVTGGTLTLYSASGSPYPLSIKPDGTFSVSDVPVGDMRVGIDTWNEPVAKVSPGGYSGGGGGQGLPPHMDIPLKYRDPRFSGLKCEKHMKKKNKS